MSKALKMGYDLIYLTIYNTIIRTSIFTYLFKSTCSGDEPSVDASKAVKTRIKAYFILASAKDNQQVQLRVTPE